MEWICSGRVGCCAWCPICNHTLWPLLDDVRADSSFRWRAKAGYKHPESRNCEMQTLAMHGAGLFGLAALFGFGAAAVVVWKLPKTSGTMHTRRVCNEWAALI